MITMSTYTVYSYMANKFPDLAKYLKNGVVDRKEQQSIGILQGSDTRSSGNLAIGGLSCTTVRMLPVNIKIRWTDNQKACDDKSVEIYNALLLEKSNFMIGEAKVACIQLLDVCPVSLGRDEKNVCESIIRANFYYYV